MNATGFDIKNVKAHYSRENLEEAILDALVAADRGIDRLRAEDLTPIDQFHIGGHGTTLELARKVGLHDGMRVLDVGCGLGGAARYLAAEFGCRVTGLDLCEKYCRVAAMLSRLHGLANRVSYRCGNALKMPFEAAAFDVLWTQHTAMNIPDKEELYGEMWRVLKPGGILAIFDILAGQGGPVYFPVPWAREPAISFLSTPQQLRATLEETGFEIVSWKDATDQGRKWFRRTSEKIGQEGSPLGLHVLLGAEFRKMAQNQVRNLEEGRVALIEAVVRVPEHVGNGRKPLS